MTTVEALDFLLSYLKSKGSIKLLDKSQWEMLKKYRNYLGFVCRDFYNKEHDKKMLVIERRYENSENGDFYIIPDENFLYFINNQSMKPLYYYAPFLSNKGLTFKFALQSQLEQGLVTLGSEAVSQKLFLKLYDIFVKNAPKENGINQEKKVTFLVEDEMFFITNYNTNDIIETLELNNIKFNEKIFDLYYNGFYDKLYPDILDIKYQFPEDVTKNSEETLNTVFVVASKGKFNEENLTRLRKLLRKLSLDDLRVARKIAMDLNIKEINKIKEVFQMEIKRRKVNNFVFN